MKSCPKCFNLAPDTALSCDQCGTVLDESVIANAGGRTGGRPETVLETPPDYRPTPPDLRPSPPAPGFRPSPPPPPLPNSMADTSPVGVPATGRRGNTVFAPPPAQSQAGAVPTPRAAARRIVGILTTYSWKPEGEIFPVREGRNLIGRGEECDICVPDDPMLSQVNSHITFRQSFVLGDMVSMSGTDLNGEPVEEQFRPLGNYAQIRTGSTRWTFVIIDPAPAPKAP